MKDDGIEDSIPSMGLVGRRRPRTREFVPLTGSAPSLSRRRRKGFVVVWATVLSSQCWSDTARGFGYPFQTCGKPELLRRNSGDSKSALWPFQRMTGDHQSYRSDRDATNDTKSIIESRGNPNATVPSLIHPMLHKSILDGIGTNPRLNRRTMASVAVTTAIVAGALPSQATPLPLDVPENRESLSRSPPKDSQAGGDEPLVDLPLEYIPTLGAYVVRFVLFGEAFAAIVDTGSPFLTVPCYCKPYRNQKMFWGCYKPERTLDSGYGNTIEGFDNNYGTVVWRKAGFSFSQTPAQHDGSETTPTPTMDTTTDVVFGVLGQDLLNGSGGVFFGLIKETDRWIRPSFLGQTGYKSFCVDLRHNNNNDTTSRADKVISSEDLRTPRLVLSKESMVGSGTWRGTTPVGNSNNEPDAPSWIPLVRDLRNKYGAPVVHYTAKASDLVVNGLPLLITKKKPLYVIFDTGVSGMVVSQELFDGRYLQARKNKEKSLWGSVEVSFETHTGTKLTLRATKPIATPLGKATPWKGFKGNLIAVGLAFLDGFATTVDIDDGKILFVEG